MRGRCQTFAVQRTVTVTRNGFPLSSAGHSGTVPGTLWGLRCTEIARNTKSPSRVSSASRYSSDALSDGQSFPRARSRRSMRRSWILSA